MCVCMCVRACMRACVCACACAYVCLGVVIAFPGVVVERNKCRCLFNPY